MLTEKQMYFEMLSKIFFHILLSSRKTKLHQETILLIFKVQLLCCELVLDCDNLQDLRKIYYLQCLEFLYRNRKIEKIKEMPFICKFVLKFKHKYEL